jgi:hypothetical protein
VTTSKLIYSENHRSALITRVLGLLGVAMIIIALVAAGMSIVGARDLWSDASFSLVIGMLLAGSHWFFVPRHYNIHNDRLVITYGRPRLLTIPYARIHGVDVLTHPLGAELRIRRSPGRNLLLQPFNPKQFHQSLEDAMSNFSGGSKKTVPSTERFPPTNPIG